MQFYVYYTRNVSNLLAGKSMESKNDNFDLPVEYWIEHVTIRLLCILN